MHQRKSKKILIYFFLFLLVGSINNINLNRITFEKIENIYIEGLDDSNSALLVNEIKKLNLKNIFFLNKKEIIEIIEKNSLVENYNILRKYPSSLDIKVKKTKFLAKINKEGKIFLVGSNGKLSKNNNSKKKLPYIFGKPELIEFLELKKKLINQKFLMKSLQVSIFFNQIGGI